MRSNELGLQTLGSRMGPNDAHPHWADGVHRAFLRAAHSYPDAPALRIGTENLSYNGLKRLAGNLAAVMDAHAPSDAPRFTAVYAHRTISAYGGVLAALFRGHAYVPVAPEFPVDRAREMLARSEVRAIVVDEQALERLPDVLADHPSCVVVSPEVEFPTTLRERMAAHILIGPGDIPEVEYAPHSCAPDDLFNLLFTSGSTGRPKGVMVQHRNMAAFLTCMFERYRPIPSDRFSQLFELVFDLHGFDLHLAWAAGACVVVPTQSDLFFLARYVRDQAITVWFSVPSTAVLMQRTHMLKPDSLPSLRLALFCGEALQTETADRMQKAAPGAVVENLYGPTEVTLACTLERFDPNVHAASPAGLVPIGHPFPEMQARIVDADHTEVDPGEPGELCLAGPQVTAGYFEDAERTSAAFTALPGVDGRWYRTGDLVRRPGPDQSIQYMGRIDHQLQISGYRVELEEVEDALRKATGSELAVAIDYPPGVGRADYIVAFVYPNELSPADTKEALQSLLPGYMIPRSIVFCEDFPLNVNGKIDRLALAAELDEE